MALEHEKHEYLLILLRWEIRISSSDIYTGNRLGSSDDIILDIVEILDQLRNINDFYSLTGKIYEGRRVKGHVRDYDELQKLNEFLSHDYFEIVIRHKVSVQKFITTTS